MAKKFLKYQEQEFEIAYEILNHSQEEFIVFLHGWGSHKEVMKQAFKGSFKGFNHLYLDLPGFGQSANAVALQTQDYAQIVGLFLEALGVKVRVIAGHSFGGKVATLLDPKELILLSSAGIVCQKPFSVRLKIRCAKLLKKLALSQISKIFRTKDAKGMNEGMYQTLKNVVDEDFSPIFATYPNQAFLFWGKQDRATPLSSGEKIHALIPQSRFFALEGDHYFFLKQAKQIESLYLQALEG